MEKKDKIDEFEEINAKEQLEKEIKHLKGVLNCVVERLKILENHSDRNNGYTMHLLQKLMSIVEKNEHETRNPFSFIKDVFKTVKNSVVWIVNRVGNQDYIVDENTFSDIINTNFGDDLLDNEI